MSSTKKILTSLHGRRIGLSQDKKLVVEGRICVVQDDQGALSLVSSTPGALNATGALTTALIKGGLVTSTTGAAVVATLDTGGVSQTAYPTLLINEAFDWSVVNTGPNAFTVTAPDGTHTLVGAGVVATGTSGHFRTRKTAANTFITYRVS